MVIDARLVDVEQKNIALDGLLFQRRRRHSRRGWTHLRPRGRPSPQCRGQGQVPAEEEDEEELVGKRLQLLGLRVRGRATPGFGVRTHSNFLLARSLHAPAATLQARVRASAQLSLSRSFNMYFVRKMAPLSPPPWPFDRLL